MSFILDQGKDCCSCVNLDNGRSQYIALNISDAQRDVRQIK